jgi:tRNA nucleotidyltransferase (CCA-adding enzyme)
MKKIEDLASALAEYGIESYYVGGCVRDEIMKIKTDDIDICLVGVTNPELTENLIATYGGPVTPLVGQKFPVWIADIDGVKVDIAMARTETLVGGTRKDFSVETQGVSIEQDLRRRDFTMNAIAKEILTGKIIDPYNGRGDIYDGRLHPTSDAFKEDTLRVYRAARFLARFPFLDASPLLRSECMSLKPNDISPERVGLEFHKVMEQAAKPSRFFMFLKSIGWLKYHFKELNNLIGIDQSPTHHPEGGAFIHTMLTLDEAKDWFTRVCMVCHDLGKAVCTTIDPIDGKIKSIGHEKEGVLLTRHMLERIHFIDRKTIRQVETMVELHMIRPDCSEKVIRNTLRRLMEKHLTYEQLVEVCRCDMSGRPPKPKMTPDIGQLRAKELLEQDAMTPIVTGEKLLAIGYTSGKLMGHLIKKALEWQDRGTLTHENWQKMIEQYEPDLSLII